MLSFLYRVQYTIWHKVIQTNFTTARTRFINFNTLQYSAAFETIYWHILQRNSLKKLLLSLRYICILCKKCYFHLEIDVFIFHRHMYKKYQTKDHIKREPFWSMLLITATVNYCKNCKNNLIIKPIISPLLSWKSFKYPLKWMG